MPPRLTSQDFDQELLILFDAYVHGDVDRRGFLDKAQRFAKAGVTAAGLLAALSPDFAAGQQVRADDARLKVGAAYRAVGLGVRRHARRAGAARVGRHAGLAGGAGDP